MQSILLQPWTTISSSLTTFTQDEEQWCDLVSYSDVAGVWIDVSLVEGTAVQLSLQSSPSHDEANFQPITPTILLEASSTPTFVKSARMASTSPLGRWLRWQLLGTGSPWGATFRIRVVVSKQLCFSPTDLSGCVLWLRSDAGVTLMDETTVSTWEDQSGHGYNVSQATQANQPGFLPNSGPNGEPDILFGSSGTVLLDNTVSNLLASGQSRTIVVAGDSNNTSGGTLCCFRRSTAGGESICVVSYEVISDILYIYSDGINGNSNAAIPGTAIPAFTPFVLDWELSTSALSAFAINGVAQTVTQNQGHMTAETSAAQGFTMGEREDTLGNPWPGDIYEMLVYDRVLLPNELIEVRRYLGARYGVAVP
jgi:hypothetical protein